MKHLKPLLTQNITLETFIDRDNHTGGSIVSSQKVGPSIADDIKTGAICSVVSGTDRYRSVYLAPFPQHCLQYRFYRSFDLRHDYDYRCLFTVLGYPAVLSGNRPDIYRCYPDGYRLLYQ